MKRCSVRLLVLAAWVAWAGCGNPSPEEPGGPSTVVTTSLEEVQPRPSPIVQESVGTVRARLESTLSSQIVGRVLAVRVREGERVEKGQTLVQIEALDSGAQLGGAEAGVGEAESALSEVGETIQAARSALESAQANAQLAEATYRRFQTLLERNSVSRQEFDEAEARYRSSQSEVARTEAMIKAAEAKRSQVEARKRQAEAALQSAHIHVDYSTIRAPFSGLVTARHIEPGDLAAPGVPLLTMEVDTLYRLETWVEESRIEAVNTGREATVRIDALAQDLRGEVAEIAPKADPNSRSFLVKIALPADSGLRSGMFGRALIETGQRPLLSVPESAVLKKGQLTGVYTVDGEGRTWFRLIRTGKREADRIEILSGLRAGDRLVTAPDASIQDGVRVQPSRGQ